MREKITDRERIYNKRLLYITPISVLIISTIFITSDYLPIQETDKRLGWKGEMYITPEITILPDTDPFETNLEEQKSRTLTSVDLNVIDEFGKAEGGIKKREEKKKDEKIIPFEEEYELVPTRPMHTDIPYSEDYIILKMVHPVYPSEELINGIEGEVTLEVLVNEDGRVENAWVLSVIGPKSFEESSLDAIKKFLFQPPTSNGKPIPMSIRFQINFKIL